MNIWSKFSTTLSWVALILHFDVPIFYGSVIFWVCFSCTWREARWNLRMRMQEETESGLATRFLSPVPDFLCVRLIFPALYADFLQNKCIHRAIRFSKKKKNCLCIYIFISCYALYIFVCYVLRVYTVCV